MILPLCFDNLNEEETLKEIKRLKRTINKIFKNPKDYYGHKTLDDGTIIYNNINPSPEVLLYWKRRFLRDGIKHLESDLHIEYIRTKQEQKEKDFWNKIKHIKKFKFNYGAWAKPKSPTITITFFNDTLDVSLDSDDECYYKDDLLKVYECHNTFIGIRYKKTKDGFLEALYDFCLDKWKKRNINHKIIDGSWFDIEIEYDNGLAPEKYEGLNSWPYGFFDLRNYMYSLAYDYLVNKDKNLPIR